MEKKVKDLFTQIADSSASQDKDSIEQFIQILELPDEQFDAVYPKFKDMVAEVFEGEEYQKQLLNTLKLHPVDNLSAEKAQIDEFLENVDSDEELSANKKEMIKTLFQSTLDTLTTLLENQREFVGVKVYKMDSDVELPSYAHPTDGGADIKANETVTIAAGETKIVKTGLKIACPAGYMVRIAPRSGLSAKTGLRVANADGTVDADYRGEVGVILSNTGTTDYTINKGDKIAQMYIMVAPAIKWTEVETEDELGSTDRGEGGYGSTGA